MYTTTILLPSLRTCTGHHSLEFGLEEVVAAMLVLGQERLCLASASQLHRDFCIRRNACSSWLAYRTTTAFLSFHMLSTWINNKENKEIKNLPFRLRCYITNQTTDKLEDACLRGF